jgi:hypothetical protein
MCFHFTCGRCRWPIASDSDDRSEATAGSLSFDETRRHPSTVAPCRLADRKSSQGVILEGHEQIDAHLNCLVRSRESKRPKRPRHVATYCACSFVKTAWWQHLSKLSRVLHRRHQQKSPSGWLIRSRLPNESSVNFSFRIVQRVLINCFSEHDLRRSCSSSPHLFIVGIPGQGKSVTTTRILCELGRQALPALGIDFHGQFTKTESLYNQVAYPAVLDAVHGLPFSPFEAEVNQSAGTNWWKSNCFAVAEIFQYVCGLGDMQRDVIY